jgi:VanZ family protein
MLQKLATAAAWLCLAFIAYATLSSIEARPVIAGGYFTVLERFGAYAVLGLLFCLAYPRNLTFVCILVFGSAVTLELLQGFVPGRDPRLLDAIEKLLGGTAGIVLAGILQSSLFAQPHQRRE